MIEVTDKKKCCGCTACQQICPSSCISMREDGEGFKYPYIIGEKCINCHLCERVCPVLNRFEAKEHPLSSYLSKTQNNQIRVLSSSGGIFTEIAKLVLKKGGVVFGAKFKKEWDVEYDFTDNEDGLSAFRGSKYVQADINSSYSKVRQFLKQGRVVLFTGTPCFVSGLLHFLGKDYDNLLTMDIVCHSIPSPKVWKKYIIELEKAKGLKVSQVTFRDKSKGWSNYSLKIDFGVENGESILETHDDNVYMRGFLHDLFTRPSCSDCPARNFTSGSDLTVADAWGINEYHPELNDEKGISHVLVNTDKGMVFWEQLFPLIDCTSIDYDEVEPNSVHSPLIRSCQPHPLRYYFFKQINNERPVSESTELCFLKQKRKQALLYRLKRSFLFQVSSNICKYLNHS